MRMNIVVGKKASVLALVLLVLTLLSLVMCTLSVTAANDISATRDILEEQPVKPGDTVTVRVTITANREVVAPALDENPPSGWKVTPVQNDGGIFKESTAEWIWVEKLSAGQSKTVIYRLTVPSDAKGTYLINGSVSAYQVASIPVGGENEIMVQSQPTPTPSPTLTPTPTPTPTPASTPASTPTLGGLVGWFLVAAIAVAAAIVLLSLYLRAQALPGYYPLDKQGRVVFSSGARDHVYGREDFVELLPPQLLGYITRKSNGGQFRIFLYNNNYYIEDSYSKNPTLVDGVSIRGKGPVVLRDGSSISLPGVFYLVFRRARSK